MPIIRSRGSPCGPKSGEGLPLWMPIIRSTKTLGAALVDAHNQKHQTCRGEVCLWMPIISTKTVGAPLVDAHYQKHQTGSNPLWMPIIRSRGSPCAMPTIRSTKPVGRGWNPNRISGNRARIQSTTRDAHTGRRIRSSPAACQQGITTFPFYNHKGCPYKTDVFNRATTRGQPQGLPLQLFKPHRDAVSVRTPNLLCQRMDSPYQSSIVLGCQ